MRPKPGSSSQITKAQELRPLGKVRTTTGLRQPHSQPSQKTSVARLTCRNSPASTSCRRAQSGQAEISSVSKMACWGKQSATLSRMICGMSVTFTPIVGLFRRLARLDSVLGQHALNHDVIALVVQRARVRPIDVKITDALFLVVCLEL